MVKKTIGFGFLVMGILWSGFSRLFCGDLCPVCNYQEISPCFFLFIFVGIIFVVVGASLILREYDQKKKIRLVK